MLCNGGLYGISFYGETIYGFVCVDDSTYPDRVPRFPKITQVDNTSLIISWEPPVESGIISGYRLYRLNKEYYDKPEPIGCTENLFYIDSGLLPENYYYYLVTSLF